MVVIMGLDEGLLLPGAAAAAAAAAGARGRLRSSELLSMRSRG